MGMEIPTATIELEWEDETESRVYILDGWDYENKRRPSTDDALIAIADWESNKPALIAPKVLGLLARRLREISNILDLGPLGEE